MGLRAIDKIRFARGKARKSRWCEVKNIELLTGYPAPLHRGVRSTNHDRRYDRRDAWVELCQEARERACCTEDEGGPFGVVLQEKAPNCHELLQSKAAVVDVMVKKA